MFPALAPAFPSRTTYSAPSRAASARTSSDFPSSSTYVVCAPCIATAADTVPGDGVQVLPVGGDVHIHRHRRIMQIHRQGGEVRLGGQGLLRRPVQPGLRIVEPV